MTQVVSWSSSKLSVTAYKNTLFCNKTTCKFIHLQSATRGVYFDSHLSRQSQSPTVYKVWSRVTFFKVKYSLLPLYPCLMLPSSLFLRSGFLLTMRRSTGTILALTTSLICFSDSPKVHLRKLNSYIKLYGLTNTQKPACFSKPVLDFFVIMLHECLTSIKGYVDYFFCDFLKLSLEWL